MPKSWFTQPWSLVHVWFLLEAPAKRLGMLLPSLANDWLIKESGPLRKRHHWPLLPPPLLPLWDHYHLPPLWPLYFLGRRRPPRQPPCPHLLYLPGCWIHPFFLCQGHLPLHTVTGDNRASTLLIDPGPSRVRVMHLSLPSHWDTA